MSGDPSRRLQLTRLRDLAAVFLALLVLAYLVIRLAYGSLPVLPRLAGISAAVVGIVEVLIGLNARARIRAFSLPSTETRRTSSPWGELKPLPPLVAARLLAVAKATALAGAGLTGIWAGVLVYVVPESGALTAAGSDAITAVIGAVAALVMTGGGLWLERCCIAPEPPSDPDARPA
jgi:Protein of unknown function (DUF3180)